MTPSDSAEPAGALRFRRHVVDLHGFGRLLWARSAPEEAAAHFLADIAEGDRRYRVVVSGHDPVPEGFDKAAPNQLVLLTSFRMHDEHKHYLEVDLAGCHRSVDDLVTGKALLRLYP